MIARSEAEGILPINNTHSYTAKGSKSIKYRFIKLHNINFNILWTMGGIDFFQVEEGMDPKGHNITPALVDHLINLI